jgi:hypothetical protein
MPAASGDEPHGVLRLSGRAGRRDPVWRRHGPQYDASILHVTHIAIDDAAGVVAAVEDHTGEIVHDCLQLATQGS